ncbi:small multi-drug export protein [Candidatus Bipolaricaulota bacterium]|nr:small multi-drug export protein [Candidatus Bipolaricaulota bacterium]
MLVVLGLSVLPVSELRGAIPVAVAFGLPPAFTYWATVGANLLVLPVVLTFLSLLLPHLERIPAIHALWGAWTRRIEHHAHRVSRWGPWALFLLVAIPLPGTGVWTAAAVAFLLEIPLRRAIVPTLAGLLIAGAVMLAASLGLLQIFV